MKGKRLSKTDILNKSNLKTIDVYIPEWDGEISIRALSAGSIAKLQEQIQDGKPKDIEHFYYKLIVESIVDEGKLVFTDEDIIELSQKEPLPINRLIIAILELNNMFPEAVEKAKEELDKNPFDSSASN